MGNWNLGRTLTHETGHYFNLQHIWGDQRGGTCDDNDGVDDTPNQFGTHYGCPAYNTDQTTSCGSNDMFMDFMDYVDDACFSLFTKGQLERSLALLDHIDGERKELTHYKQYNNQRFINHFYFRVLDNNDPISKICADTDLLLDYTISSELIDGQNIYSCLSTTDNQNVDVIIDLQPTYSLDIAKEGGYDYCMETNLGTENDPMFICYKKGSFNDIKNRIQDIKIFVLDQDMVELQFGDKYFISEYNEYKLKFIKEITESDEYIYLGYKHENAVDQIQDRKPIDFYEPGSQYDQYDGYGVDTYSKPNKGKDYWAKRGGKSRYRSISNGYDNEYRSYNKKDRSWNYNYNVEHIDNNMNYRAFPDVPECVPSGYSYFGDATTCKFKSIRIGCPFGSEPWIDNECGCGCKPQPRF